eukprot:SAG31_NODE_23690_length_498_cov_1.283208_1_plen_53_part_01
MLSQELRRKYDLGGRAAAQEAAGGFVDSETLFGLIFGSQLFDAYVGELLLQTE